jgi:GH15 family glucan-1,4-alpha-glucosidase
LICCGIISSGRYNYCIVHCIIFTQGQTITVGQVEFKKIISHLISEGDLYLMRVIYHANPDGSLSEQFNRENGYMQGAPNLTWSHASFITAKLKRDQVNAALKRR